MSISEKENILLAPELLNPFVHKLQLLTTWDKIKTAIFTLILLVPRLILIGLLLVCAWILACIGLIGLSEEDLTNEPLTGWRRSLVRILCWIGRSTYQVGGMKIKVKGRQASRNEAPVLVIAPHSTFMDAVIVYVTGFPSIISRRESGLNPFIGKLINYTQPIYVWRDDPDSRHKTIGEIVRRTTSNLDWPQVLIFPEGTCTNRSCLITFKPGAFYPGVAVQPVCIRYPNKLDTVTWTWEGPGFLTVIWLTLTRLNSVCEIEFLPVYHPNEEEKQDPKLYANNVRNVMAKALGIPVTDYTYADCLLLNRALELNIPSPSDLIKVQKLRNKLGLNGDKLENEISRAENCPKFINLLNFCDILNISKNDPIAAQLFSVFDKNENGCFDIKNYLLDCLVIYKKPKTEEMVQLAFKAASDKAGLVDRKNSIKVFQISLSLSYHEAEKLYRKVDRFCKGCISYNEFLQYARRKKRFQGILNKIDDNISESHSSDDEKKIK